MKRWAWKVETERVNQTFNEIKFRCLFRVKRIIVLVYGQVREQHPVKKAPSRVLRVQLSIEVEYLRLGLRQRKGAICLVRTILEQVKCEMRNATLFHLIIVCKDDYVEHHKTPSTTRAHNNML